MKELIKLEISNYAVNERAKTSNKTTGIRLSSETTDIIEQLEKEINSPKVKRATILNSLIRLSLRTLQDEETQKKLIKEIREEKYKDE